MHRLLTAAAFAALAAAPAFAAEPLTFGVTFNDTILNSKPDGLSLGDRFIIDDVLTTDGRQTGTTSGVCTITNVEGVALCNVTFILADGSLSIQFVNSPPPVKDFAILGGTGAYAGAMGVGQLIENGDNTGKVTFTLN